MSITVLYAGRAAAPTAQMLAAIIGNEVNGPRQVTESDTSMMVGVLRSTAAESSLVLIVSGNEWQCDPLHLTALDACTTTRLPGFSPILTQLCFEQSGPAAIQLSAGAGRLLGADVVILPANDDICRCAWERILKPLRQQTSDAVTEQTQVDPPQSTPEPGLQLDLDTPESQPPPEEEGGSTSWLTALVAIGGVIKKRSWPSLPEVFDRIAPVRNVLERAGERAVVERADGSDFVAFGYPDLRRASSKVLLVRGGSPIAEVVALHRHPRSVGIVAHGTGGVLPTADGDANQTALRVTGRALPSDGSLFALDTNSVWTVRDGKVWRWDGRQEQLEGTPSQAMATLLLTWSQR